MQFGALRFQRTQLGQDNFDLPKAPALAPELIWIWRCWQRLNIDRPWLGGGLGPSVPARITWKMTLDWANHLGYNAEELRFLDMCIMKLDETYLEYFRLKNTKASSSNSAEDKLARFDAEK